MEDLCLICGALTQQDPLAEENTLGSNKSIVRRAFPVFCQLLNLHESIKKNEIKQNFKILEKFALGSEDIDNEDVFPTCPACCHIFSEILDLQKIIDDTRIVQQKLAETLEDTLLKSSGSDGVSANCHFPWKKIRAELIDCCLDAASVEDCKPININITPLSPLKSSSSSPKVIKERKSFSEITTNLIASRNIGLSKCKLTRPLKKSRKVHKGKSTRGTPAKKIEIKPELLEQLKLHLIKPCSVVVTRLKIASDIPCKENDSQSLPFPRTTSLCYEEKKEDDKMVSSCRRNRSRQSKIKAYKFIREHAKNADNESEQYSVEAESNVNVTSNDTVDDVDILRQHKHNTEDSDHDYSVDSPVHANFESDGDDVDFESDEEKTKKKDEPTRTKSKRSKHRDLHEFQSTNEASSSDQFNHSADDNLAGVVKKTRNRSSKFFYAIDKTVLLCRCSLVKLSPDNLECKEFNCSTTVEGSTFDSFQTMLKHIDDVHERDYSDKPLKRECPLCKEEFFIASEFRHHLKRNHGVMKRIVCEVCKKQLRSCGSVRKHYRAFHVEQLQMLDKKIKGKFASPVDQSKWEARVLQERKNRQLAKFKSRMKKLRRKKTKGKRQPKTTVNIEDVLFYIINKDMLCCGSTLIKITPTNMVCLYPNCSVSVEGTDSYTFQKMSDHIKSHESEETDQDESKICPLCRERFQIRQELQNHLLNHHSSEIIRVMCPECREGVPVETFKQHYERLHKRSRPYSRWEANENFLVFGENWGWMLYKYSVFLRSPVNFSCREKGCNEVIHGSDYFAFEQVRKHVAEVHNLNRDNYKGQSRFCPCCEAKFKEGLSLRTHIIRTHGPKIICPSCWRILRTITEHRWLHYNEEERAAAIAAGGIEKSEIVKRKLEIADLSLQCSRCPKRFKNKHNLSAHEETHLAPEFRKQFKCPEENCDVVVLSKPALRSHIERRHRPEQARLRGCPICPRLFHIRDGESYRRHVRSHKNETPYVCHECGNGFVCHESLKRHAAVHSTERPFQCEFCAMSYKYSRNLKRHRENTHKDLVSKTAVSERLKQIRGEKIPMDFIGPRRMYPCEFCDKPFELPSRLKKHALICKHQFDGTAQ